MKKRRIIKMLSTIAVLVFGYIVLCIIIYFSQEKLLFFPTKLPVDYPFEFDSDYEEISIITGDSIVLNGLLFTTDSSNGLIFYLHGNAGALDSWGDVAKTYTRLNYDIFILDYRGYGKSEGSISSEEQFYSDIQRAYNEIKLRYNENDIIVLGYSLGTAAAAMLASLNNPQMLILQAPYYSLIDLKKKIYPFLPDFLIKYKFKTFAFLDNTKVPVTIFHGNQDEVIYYGSSLKLKEHLKPGDQLITLQGQHHNGITDNSVYQKHLSQILKNN